MTGRVLLVADLSYQVYRAAAAHPELVSARGDYTGGLYGFLQSLGKAVRETRATEIVACRDSKPYVRSLEYPEYKMLRKGTMDPDLRERYEASEPLVLELLAVAGVPVWSVPGFEVDDLAGHVVRRHRSRYSAVHLWAKDSDFFQLLDAPNVSVFRDGIATAVTAASLLRDTGLTPAQHALASALSGTHNGVAGIPDCGEKRSRAAVLDPARMRKYRDGWGAVINRNIGLIALPHRDFPRGEPVPRRTAPFSERALYRWLAGHDIDCTHAMVTAFEQTSRDWRRN